MLTKFLLSLLFLIPANLYVVYEGLELPKLCGHIIDLMLGAGRVDFAAISPILMKMLEMICVDTVLHYLIMLVNSHLANGYCRDLRKKAFSKINRLPLSYLDSHSSGEILSIVINDIDTLNQGLLLGINQLINATASIFMTIWFMWKISALCCLVVVVLTPLSLLVARFIANNTYSYSLRQSQLKGQLTGYINEMITSGKLVTQLNYQQASLRRFDITNDELDKVGFNATFYSSITNPSTRFVNNLVYAALGLTSAFSALDGKITIGQMSTMLSYASKYTTPFNEISSVIAELQNALACYRRIRDLLELPEERQQELYGLDVNGVRGSVDFDKVCFSYVKERPLLQDVDIHIAAGQKVAIVGPTGCGKTTLVNLLLRFYDTDSGTIRIDGIDTQQLSRDELRDCFGMVLQDSWLKEGTIRENLTMGNPDISDQQLIEACQRCHCHQFITLLKDGYDTYVRPDEEQFSAGQKQLLCITRAMLSDPRILILDEATSNIDSNTEVLVQKAFDALMQNKTSFIIAHRLSTIRNADLILVLKDGHIIEQGNHQQLLEKQGFYFTLYNSQFTSQ